MSGVRDTNNQPTDLKTDTSGRLLTRAVDANGSGLSENTNTGALVTLAASAASGNSGDLTNLDARGLHLGINITALTGTTPTLTVIIEGKDTASGQYYTLLTSTALAAVAFTLLSVYPGITASANIAASQVLPRTYRIRYTIAGTTPAVTATIGASVIQ